jgi:hypothetical protein
MPVYLTLGISGGPSKGIPLQARYTLRCIFLTDRMRSAHSLLWLGIKIHMRILVTVAPKMYRETLAHLLRTDRPDDDVRLADPQALDREASSFGPHLVVCNDNAPEVREGVSVPSWVVIRFHDHLSASVFIGDQDPRLIQDIAIEDLIWVVEETQRLVA